MFVVDYGGEWDSMHVAQQHCIFIPLERITSIGVGGGDGTMDRDYWRGVLCFTFSEGNEGAHNQNESTPPRVATIEATGLAEAGGVLSRDGGALPHADWAWPMVE